MIGGMQIKESPRRKRIGSPRPEGERPVVTESDACYKTQDPAAMEEATVPTASTCRLKVIRRSGYADYLRSYEILVNGEQIGMIARNGVLDVEIPSGQVSIEARLDWGRSRALTVEAGPNQTIEIEVANHWGALLALWAITFGSRTYLTLKILRT